VWFALGLGGARSASARSASPECVFSTQVATTLLAAHPEADRDGDGALSRAEACELQAELRKRLDSTSLDALVSTEEAAIRAALAEPICCNCQGGEGMSSPSADLAKPSAPGLGLVDQACVAERERP